MDNGVMLHMDQVVMRSVPTTMATQIQLDLSLNVNDCKLYFISAVLLQYCAHRVVTNVRHSSKLITICFIY